MWYTLRDPPSRPPSSPGDFVAPTHPRSSVFTVPRAILYTRELPGGGFVAIDSLTDSRGHHARLWVERRSDPARRFGHLPPIIAECQAPNADAALDKLRPIAADNLTLAHEIRRWQAQGRE